MCPASISPNRAAGRLAISGLVKEGFSANRIISVLKDLGLSYRRQVMLDDIRQYSGLFKLEGVTSSAPQDALFPIHAMVPTDLRRGFKYRIYGEVEFFDPISGEVTRETVSWYSMNRDSKQGWIDEFLTSYSAGARNTGEVLGSVTVKSVEHQKGFPY